MHYVKYFTIENVDTKQVACIELQGVPNAATEGAVGVLGMDMTSPTHEVYRCVAVNGSVYTWELLSAGMSIVSATTTGEGAITQNFPYDNLRIPTNYLIKPNDLILDSEGYLYQITTIGSTSCEASYCGTHIGGIPSGDKDRSLVINNGQLQLVTESGKVLSTLDYHTPDGATIHRDSVTGEISVIGVTTLNDTRVQFFVGTQAAYNNLPTVQKEKVFAFITDDSTLADFERSLNNIIIGETVVKKASMVKGEVKTVTISQNSPSSGASIELENGSVYVVEYAGLNGILWGGTYASTCLRDATNISYSSGDKKLFVYELSSSGQMVYKSGTVRVMKIGES